MFTGIVDHCGTVKKIAHVQDTLSAWIECNYHDLALGESISIDGVCLTVVEHQPQIFRCDISSETCRLTTAKDYQPGSTVNIERALKASDRMGGHFVTGHVDQLAYVVAQQPEGEFTAMRFGGIAKPLARKFFIRKGCVAVNGVSVTINEVHDDGFSVMLIPHTLEKTNLKNLKLQDAVNLEFDWMVKIVSQQIENIKQSLVIE